MPTAQQVRRDTLAATDTEDLQDAVDARSAAGETAQEMHERMQAEDASEETLDVLAGLRALQSGELVNWHVFRVAGPQGEPLKGAPSQFVAVLGSAQLTMQNIASLYGGGKYRVRGHYADGKFAGQRTIDIAPDATRDIAMQSMPNAAGGFNMTEWLAFQEQREAAREAREEQRRREDEIRVERDRKNRLELITALGTVLAPILTPLAGKLFAGGGGLDPAVLTLLKPERGGSLKDMIETLAALDRLRAPAVDSGGSETAQIIQAVAGLAGPAMQLAAQARAQAPVPVRARPARLAAPTAPGAAPTVVPAPVSAAVPRAPLPGEAPTVLQPATAPQSGVDLAAPSQLLTTEQSAMFAQIKPQVDSLVEIARQGADPVAVADTFFDTTMTALEDGPYNQLCAFFESPDVIQKIAIFNTGVNEHRNFFENLRNRLVQRITQEDVSASAPPT